MPKLTDIEKKSLEDHAERISAAIRAGDLHALDALHAREEIKKLDGRRRIHLADETVRELWEKHKASEHFQFRMFRSVIRLMLYANDVSIEVTRRRVCETQVLINRIAELEKRPALKYCGTFDPSQEYTRGDLLTHDGSMWHCERSTRDKPPSADWKLCVRKGKDAR